MLKQGDKVEIRDFSHAVLITPTSEHGVRHYSCHCKYSRDTFKVLFTDLKLPAWGCMRLFNDTIISNGTITIFVCERYLRKLRSKVKQYKILCYDEEHKNAVISSCYYQHLQDFKEHNNKSNLKPLYLIMETEILLQTLG